MQTPSDQPTQQQQSMIGQQAQWTMVQPPQGLMQQMPQQPQTMQLQGQQVFGPPQQQQQWTMVQPLQQPQTNADQFLYPPQLGNVSGYMPLSPAFGQMPGPPMGLQPPMLSPPMSWPQPFHPAGPLPGHDQRSYDDDDALEENVGATASIAQHEPDPTVNAEGPLSITTKVEYTALPKDRKQEVFGLVTLQATAQQVRAANDRQPMDIVTVLDVSGSMNGNKIRQVKDAMRFLISQAHPHDRLSIVTFNDRANRVLKLRKMTAEGKNDANVAVVRLSAGGGTRIASGLDMALQVMEQRRQKNKVAAILLLTDGQDGSTRSHLPRLLQRAQHANCAVYPFGFGADHDARLLSSLAEQAQTPFSFVEDTEAKIREAFAGTIGGLTSVVAQDVELTLKCNVQLKHLHTPFVTNHECDNQTTITIPDIFAGERRDILVELVVPEDELQICSEHLILLEASARYVDLKSGGAVQTPVVLMQVEAVEEPQPEQEPDEDVCVQRERVQVQQALQEAVEKGDHGDFQSAQHILSTAESRLRPTSQRCVKSVALGQQLQEARSQMQNRSLFERQGRAFMSDMSQMHSVQRCTNMGSSAAQGMYCTEMQQSMIMMSSGSF